MIPQVAIPLNARKGIGWPDVMNYVTGTLGASDLTGEANETSFLVASGLRASDGHHGHSSPRGDGGDNLIAFQSNAGSRLADEVSEDYFGPVRKGSGGASAAPPAISGAAGVRRLTPLECERLMGYPDDHTRWTADGREITDSHRYRMCGNGVVSTVAEWLGWRLIAVEAMRCSAANTRASA